MEPTLNFVIQVHEFLRNLALYFRIHANASASPRLQLKQHFAFKERLKKVSVETVAGPDSLGMCPIVCFIGRDYRDAEPFFWFVCVLKAPVDGVPPSLQNIREPLTLRALGGFFQEENDLPYLFPRPVYILSQFLHFSRSFLLALADGKSEQEQVHKKSNPHGYGRVRHGNSKPFFPCFFVCPGGTLTPVPESATLLGLLGALVRNVRAAVRTPVADGVKVMVKMQFAPTARLAPQAFPKIKSAAFAPVTVMLVMFSVAVPLFVSVTVCAMLGIETVTFPKDKVVGFRVTDGTGAATPVPESAALLGLLEALVRNVSEADLPPSADGVNVTLTVQLRLAARLAPQVFTEIAKSPAFAPLSETLVIVTVAGPVFVSVAVCEALVPATTILPNA